MCDGNGEKLRWRKEKNRNLISFSLFGQVIRRSLRKKMKNDYDTLTLLKREPLNSRALKDFQHK